MPVAQDLTVELVEIGHPPVVKTIESAGLPVGAGTFPWPEIDDSDFPVLATIDEYGETYFSGRQMQWLVPELQHLRSRCKTAAQAAHMEQVLILANKCANGDHLYLAFLGD